MKKVALSLAGVLAAAAFAPEASALPAFARQTGMACSACHFMKFPVLNGFGRAFKAAGYTLMGAQGKVEGEHLSIPDTLNAAILLKYRYQKDNTVATVGAGKTAATANGDGMWQMGDEFSLFFGGRVADSDAIKIGFLMENNTANVGGALVAGLRLPIVYDLGTVTVSAVPFTTDALGVQYGYELSSGGVMRANRWAEHRRETSAVQYNADRAGNNGAVGAAGNGAASGHAFVVKHDLFFVNYTIWSSSFAPGGNGGGIASTNYGQKYIRVAATPSFAGFDFVAGFGKESGSSYANLAAVQVESNQTFFDVQAQGEIGGMEAGIYFQNAKAPACTTAVGAGCVHNDKTQARTATTLGAEFAVIPHTLNLGAAIRQAKNGKVDSAVAGAGNGDNAVTFTAVYDLFQNVALHANYSKYSGSAHGAANNGSVDSLLTMMLEAAW